MPCQQGFPLIPPVIGTLSTGADRQITPHPTTSQQARILSPQIIHRIFLLREIATFMARVSTITIQRELWQNLATTGWKAD
jgi:hypothetical protein